MMFLVCLAPGLRKKILRLQDDLIHRNNLALIKQLYDNLLFYDS